MIKRTSAAVIAAMLTFGSASAFASDNDVRLDQKTEQAIKEKLTAKGYDVRRITTEDGIYEVYAVKDGERSELQLNRDLKIVSTKDND